MAILKKGSRKIVVESIEYRWNIRRKPTHSQADFSCNVTASAELSDASGTVLVITFLWNNYHYYEGTEHPITPKHIQESITGAINAGWEPSKQGAQFNYEHKTSRT